MTKRNKGFTLVELLVVVAIISMLALIGGAAYISAQKRGRNARRAADIQQIRSALEMIRTDKGHYPEAQGCETSLGSAASCSTFPTGTQWDTSTVGNFGDDLVTEYMSSLPVDVLNNSTYYYRFMSYQSDGSSTCDNSSTTTQCMTYELIYFEEPLTGSTPVQKTVENP